MANFTKYNYMATLAIMRHDFRTPQSYKNKNIDPEKSHLNKIIGPTQTYEEARDKLKDALATIPHSNRKDLVTGIGYCVTLPAQATTPQEEEAFFEEAYKQLVDRFGEKNILCAAIHNDEKKKHLQAIILPIIKDESNEAGKRFCAKKFLNKKVLSVWHKDLQERIDKKKELQFFKVLYKPN